MAEPRLNTASANQRCAADVSHLTIGNSPNYGSAIAVIFPGVLKDISSIRPGVKTELNRLQDHKRRKQNCSAFYGSSKQASTVAYSYIYTHSVSGLVT